MIDDIERYYDTAPRPFANTEQVGPFTLFTRTDPAGWHYYARPTLGGDAEFTPDDVCRVLTRQRELGVPRSIEWTHEVTPSLLAAARSVGMTVEECPLLELGTFASAAPLDGYRLTTLDADDPRIADVAATVHAGFGETDQVGPGDPGTRPTQIAQGLHCLIGAFDAHGRPVAGGSHGPRGAMTELVGIATLPSHRGRGIGAAITAALTADALELGLRAFLSAASMDAARIYQSIGYERVGTACIAAEPAESKP